MGTGEPTIDMLFFSNKVASDSAIACLEASLVASVHAQRGGGYTSNTKISQLTLVLPQNSQYGMILVCVCAIESWVTSA